MNKADALSIAKRECEARGIAWHEPALARWGLLQYTVTTNTRIRGGNVIIRVRKREGAVVALHQVPR